MSVAVGSVAPDFELKNNHGTPVRLSELRGSRVLVVFFPFAFSGICTGELCELRDNISLFERDDVTLLAVSCDPMFTQKAWAEQENYSFDLLSDFWPHGAVAREYGVFDEDNGLSIRGSFLIDEEGVVRWAVVNGRGQARDFARYREALAAL
ncbi:peroxiredoxin [Populibacterium corticicola]|uniref:Peroxiredoxin n=1 Tax=Populibacterium corticicola TaxID=1812826 RepID=A0ABW5XB85_9MICO